MGKFYAVYQSGFCVYGVGTTPNEAIDDALEWVDFERDELVEPHSSVYGDVCLGECSEAFSDYVQQHGGDIPFSEQDGILRLESELG